MSEQILENLSGVRLFSELEPNVLKEIKKNCTFKHYSAQDLVIDRQSETKDIFFIISGSVRVANYSLSGRIIAFADLIEGSHFGELAALDNQPRSASVFALSSCLLGIITQERFIDLLKDEFSVALKVMEALAQVIRTSTDRIMDLSTLAANNRVQADILRLANDCGIYDSMAEISPIPIHSDIASRVSTSRETVARVLMDLARRGIVMRQKNSLLVKNVKELSNIVEKVRGD